MSEAQLVMLWYSHVNPNRPKSLVQGPPKEPGLVDEKPHPRELFQMSHACAPGFYCHTISELLTIPIWVLPALNTGKTNVHVLFDTAKQLFESSGPEWQETFAKVAKAELYWDIPQWVFMLWVDAYTDQALLARDLHTKKITKWKSYSCRIIQDADGSFSFIPYWTADCITFGDDSPFANQPWLPDMPPMPSGSGICVFGDPRREECSILTYRHLLDKPLPKNCPQSLRVGFGNLERYKRPGKKDLRKEIVKHYNEMWENLERIFIKIRLLDIGTLNRELWRATIRLNPNLPPTFRQDTGQVDDLIHWHKDHEDPDEAATMYLRPQQALS
ncbi:MAG: hypothetical protein Q9221_003560 [Calogaya cf. arnoldii]